MRYDQVIVPPGKGAFVDFDEASGRFVIACKIHMNSYIKKLPERRFLKSISAWTASPIRQNIEGLEKFCASSTVVTSEKAREKLKEHQSKSDVQINKVKFPVAFPFKTQPFGHQLDALDFTYSLDEAAYFCEMGTGKTKMCIDRTSCKWTECIIDAVMIACPATIRKVWIDEVRTHCPFDNEVIIVDTSTPAKRKKMEEIIENPKAGVMQFFVFSYESFSQGDEKGHAYKLATKLLNCRRCELATDEVHYIKNPSSNRSGNIHKLARLAKSRSAYTGTPVLNGPLDLYSIFEFLNPDIIGIGNYYSFKRRYAIWGGYENRELLGYDNLDELIALIKPYIFQCTKDQVLDLPPKIYQERFISMTKEQEKLYKQVKKDRFIAIPESEDLEFVMENVLTVHGVLQQITEGFMRYKDPEKGWVLEEIMVPENNPKIKELMSLVEEIGDSGKCLIWCKYKYSIEAITKVLSKKYGPESIGQIHGDVPKELRDSYVDEFNDSKGKIRFMVMNLATGKAGYTLNAAKYSFYYSNSFSYEQRAQSEDRNHRIGQESSVTYVDLLMEGSIDQKIKEAVENKLDLAMFVKARIREVGFEQAMMELGA